MDSWTEDRFERAVRRYNRFSRLKAALGVVAFLAVAGISVDIAIRHGLLWGLAAFFVGGPVLSVVAIPVVLLIGLVVAGKDGMAVARNVQMMKDGTYWRHRRPAAATAEPIALQPEPVASVADLPSRRRNKRR